MRGGQIQCESFHLFALNFKNDKTIKLNQRVELERKKTCDYFVSFHRNAFKPEQASGAEVFVFNQNSKAKPLADSIQQTLVKAGFTNQGVKTAQFYVLKYTKAPALLLEVCFIDHTGDNQLFDQQFNQIATGIQCHSKTHKIP